MTLVENINRILEVMDLKEPIHGRFVAVLVGGLDNRKYDKPISQQLQLFKAGFGDSNVRAFRYSESPSNIEKFLSMYPKLPIFMFSKGCELADELINSPYVDKNKIYLIEPYNSSSKNLNSSVKRAIQNGLPVENIFVSPNNTSRGFGFKGASDSGAKGHWESLTSVGKKFAL